MTRDAIIKTADMFTETDFNILKVESALSPDLTGLRFFDAPILAFGAASDPMFVEFQDPRIIGTLFKPPSFWLKNAKSVISFFLPFTKAVRDSNYDDIHEPSPRWYHARVEGQEFVIALCRHLEKFLADSGHNSVIPAIDSRFCEEFDGSRFQSSWSERHTAYICGLGTFGLSAGIITEQGMAGRLGSIVTDAEFTADSRPYDDAFGYCIRCNACISRCPAGAITPEGMDKALCSERFEETKRKHKTWYRCGKCQVRVPCESRRP